jgi:hypothetical protein
MLAAKGVEVPIAMIGGDEGRDCDRETACALDCRLRDPLQRGHRRREQVLVSVGEQVGEPHGFKIAARNPQAAGIERFLDPFAIGFEIEFVPGTLDPEIVETFPMDTRHAVRIFHPDDRRIRKGLLQ